MIRFSLFLGGLEATVAKGQITVTSHVGRDLLQSAGVFRHERNVVWEYVSNGLQYIDSGVNPLVRVFIGKGKNKKIVIADNGTGMDWDGLSELFFVMHGVNEERKRGKVGRGRFGTGKSAAFGIASTLRVTTVRKCKRSKVELKRTAIEAMSQGDPVPVSTIDKEVKTEEPNGTTIEIEDLNIKHVDQASIIKFIEKHIYHWPNATVFVNHHEIELTEPPINFERRFRPCEPEIREAIGDVELVVKVSKSPLELEQQGIAIMSDGVWHENTLAGLEKKEFANFMFGEIDVPKLNADNSNISPFDLSRSMTLNRSNEMVLSIPSFVGSSVESVRRELVTAEKARRAGEEARQLERHASEISEIINTDFSDFKTKLKQVHAKGPGGTDTYPSSGTGDDDIASKLIEGTTIPAVDLMARGERVQMRSTRSYS